MSGISTLECSQCHQQVSAEASQTVCALCGGSLYGRFSMDEVEHAAKREERLRSRPLPTSLPVGGIITPQ
jgi:formate-dependent nitrite reductase cytochrome c552 subunit